MEGITLASTYVLCPDLLSLILVANFGVMESSKYKLKKRYIKRGKVDTSNTNL